MKRPRSETIAAALPCNATLLRLIILRLDLHDLAPLWRCTKFLSSFSTDDELCMSYVREHPDIPWNRYYEVLVPEDLCRTSYSRASRSFALWYYYADHTNMNARMLLSWHGFTDRLLGAARIPTQLHYKRIVCQAAVAAGQVHTLQTLLDNDQGRYSSARRDLVRLAIEMGTEQCLPVLCEHPKLIGKVANDSILQWAVQYKNRNVLTMAPDILQDNGGHENGYQMCQKDIPWSKHCSACLLNGEVCDHCLTLPDIQWLVQRQWIE